jgi:hypothetical protein
MAQSTKTRASVDTTADDMLILKKYYDKNGDGDLSSDEIRKLVDDYHKNPQAMNSDVIR